ncbi:hypothetical protein DI09_181p40 [Mitosporidium daphniae]|uniref:Uncharacterized protein n=1 Tax=Mitosporidium daphniae TaxID=1485682 RepID=A0A098VTI0_9MICR|nr:uncharacterized protein DI09_181p40 [Mitosporidium daphniae]KGG52363.1 hypothetical protein DI09_181p40 [Mitosporidium daphniae]|eukprot:XP_013238799.1 uncharacterized protein DI09_181p40 [Mitosporidium daphniae]
MLTGREWRQNFNLDGLLYAFGNIWRLPSLLRPRLVVKDISSITLCMLRDDLKLKGIVFDKDNCLTIPYQDSVDQRVEERVREIAHHFECIIVSNGAGGPDDFATEPRVRYHWHPHFITPSQGCRKLDSNVLEACLWRGYQSSIRPDEIAIIGDRLFTDIFMANYSGMVGILTHPLNGGEDPLSVKLVRQLEAFFLKFLSKV